MTGMFAAMLAHLEKDDEVILLEPYFDQYFASIAFQGAKPVFVPLHPPSASSNEWTLDINEFAAAFTPKTKCVIINTPHNPVGKVFSRKELEGIAEVCVKNNVLVLADEVYDCMVYDGLEHVRIATLPGMWERTLTVGSGGSESGSSCVSYLECADLTCRILRLYRLAYRYVLSASIVLFSH
jgi:kynurenine aminotransferase